MAFRITGLAAEPFRHLYGLADTALAEHGAIRYIADAPFSFPDRIEMRHANRGESLLLINHVCQPADTPYHASHAIFILEGAMRTYSGENEVPAVMTRRMQSLRAFDDAGMMVDADVAEGEKAIVQVIERMFKNRKVSCIHGHNARQGCYSGLISRL